MPNLKDSIFLATAMLIGGVSVSVNASQLSLRFAGPSAFDDQSAGTCINCGPVHVEVLWTQTAQEAQNGLGGLTFSLTAAPENPNPGVQGENVPDFDLDVSNFSTPLPNWVVSPAPGDIGAGNFSAFASLASESLTTPGTTVIAEFDIWLNFPGVLTHEFYIRRSFADFTPDVVSAIGSSYTFNPTNPDGYYGFYDIGNGYAGDHDGTGSLPMTIYDLVPEPASFTLVAFGAMALRRKTHGRS